VTFPLHELSRRALIAIAAGEADAASIAVLTAAELSKHRLLISDVVRDARLTGHRHASRALAACELLDTAWRRDAAATDAVIRHPSVAVWARRTIEACHGRLGPPPADPAGLAAVAASASIRAGLDVEIGIPVIDGFAVLPGLGAALATGQRVLVHTAPGASRVGEVAIPSDPARDAPGWHGLRRIRAGSLEVVLDDLDPFRAPDLPDLVPHGDSAGWRDVLTGAWPVLADGHPVAAAEIAAVVRSIVPRSRPPAGAVSSSSAEAFGAVTMSLPPDPVTCAELLVHEVMHLVLGAVLDLADLTRSDDGSRYYAPWRDDPRPVTGLLQGAYAFFGVAGFWRRQRLRGSSGRGHVEFARWRAGAASAVRTLQASGRLTDTGTEFAAEMARVLDRWQGEPIPAAAAEQALQEARAHRERWESAHGPSGDAPHR
jgi:HEXXH motif-containing protein